MDEPKKYCLGNQPEEYELSKRYLGWVPVDYDTWDELIFDENKVSCRPCPIRCTLADTTSERRVALILHRLLSMEALPLEIYAEECAQFWSRIAIVSLEEEPATRFIIPLH